MTKARPSDLALKRLRLEADDCTRCDLWKKATQTVFGTGPSRARLMFVGEQPGDQEDLEGAPFVGPAGRLLRRALEQAGIDVDQVYLTNAVKHFKWKPRGKRRLHEKPNRVETTACRLWLELEIQAVRPRVLVALGATAARSLLGKEIAVTRNRTRRFPSPLADILTVTVHPSAILRAPDADARAAALEQFVADLRTIGKWAAAAGNGEPDSRS